MEGGKKLAEGGYGCVFSPSINCSGKESCIEGNPQGANRYPQSL